MVLLDPVADGPLALGSGLTLRFAGAESNVAVTLARLGVSVSWVSRLGSEPLGILIRDALALEGVDTSLVQLDERARTGIFFKWREHGRSSVAYYRRGSAACNLTLDDVPESALDDVEAVHLTGITLALGDGPRSLVAGLAERARRRGATVVFDPNYRNSLWAGSGQAAEAQSAILPFVDWYLCGYDEGCRLFDVTTPGELFDAVETAGMQAVVRIGARGALVRVGGEIREVPPVRLATVTDEIGAGDAFAGGFVYGLLQGWPSDVCAGVGNLIAAAALAGTGDWETLPHLADVQEQLRKLAHHRSRPER
jgi:2-dehydro-3-deoxygluconokinase